MPKCRLRPPYSPASTLPPPSISVSVDGARSAEPPTSSGTSAAAHWITSCDALRVAIMPASGPFFGTSAPKPSGSAARQQALELGRLGARARAR